MRFSWHGYIHVCIFFCFLIFIRHGLMAFFSRVGSTGNPRSLTASLLLAEKNFLHSDFPALSGGGAANLRHRHANHGHPAINPVNHINSNLPSSHLDLRQQQLLLQQRHQHHAQIQPPRANHPSLPPQPHRHPDFVHYSSDSMLRGSNPHRPLPHQIRGLPFSPQHPDFIRAPPALPGAGTPGTSSNFHSPFPPMTGSSVSTQQNLHHPRRPPYPTLHSAAPASSGGHPSHQMPTRGPVPLHPPHVPVHPNSHGNNPQMAAASSFHVNRFAVPNRLAHPNVSSISPQQQHQLHPQLQPRQPPGYNSNAAVFLQQQRPQPGGQAHSRNLAQSCHISQVTNRLSPFHLHMRYLSVL